MADVFPSVANEVIFRFWIMFFVYYAIEYFLCNLILLWVLSKSLSLNKLRNVLLSRQILKQIHSRIRFVSSNGLLSVISRLYTNLRKVIKSVIYRFQNLNIYWKMIKRITFNLFQEFILILGKNNNNYFSRINANFVK